MDDLDDLLDEIEQSFEQPPQSRHKKTLSKAPSTSSLDKDIDDILRDTPLPTVVTPKASVKHEVSRSTRDLKCSRIFLGGSNSIAGHYSGKSNRSCDSLRCTSCDFRVLQFEDVAWSKDTDYLFLRNNMPDYNRLKNNLIRCRGTRAYACQCSWKSIPQNVLKPSDLKWVCGKHKVALWALGEPWSLGYWASSCSKVKTYLRQLQLYEYIYIIEVENACRLFSAV